MQERPGMRRYYSKKNYGGNLPDTEYYKIYDNGAAGGKLQERIRIQNLIIREWQDACKRVQMNQDSINRYEGEDGQMIDFFTALMHSAIAERDRWNRLINEINQNGKEDGE